ncbi:protein-disulfide reductase DsbD domain-containing protein [Pseudahrensia aquimaris]|uniref:Protein-disulfide reductase DsbD domain-containing protein n=1 Tax=Pseudahrensia aquimaris TaxID=744461 RepID=A0ABW3FBV2_9HYPH
MKTLLALTILLFANVSAHAASSDWVKVDGAKMRLIGMPSLDNGPYRAGLQIELEPGWKTYWRNPGASGLPPQLDFSASKNVNETQLKFPAPHFFAEDSSIGYKNSVTFPISVTPTMRGFPMALDVNGIVGICSDICIPTQVQLSLQVGKSAISQMDVAMALNKSQALLPTQPEQGFAIEDVMLQGEEKPALVVMARVPIQAEDVRLFVEGPQSWYLDRAELISRKGTLVRFSVDVSEAKSREDILAADLVFTLATQRKAIEQTMKAKAAQ